jgi:hypothetical protein
MSRTVLAKLEWLKRNNVFYQDEDRDYAHKVEETSESIKQVLQNSENTIKKIRELRNQLKDGFISDTGFFHGLNEALKEEV